MPPKVTFKIQTQQVAIHRDDGTRIHYSRKRPWRDWDRHAERLDNVREAVAYANRTRDLITPAQWGCVVVVRRVINDHSSSEYEKIYEAKVGTDGQLYDEFSGVAGEYWRRRLEGRMR